MHQVIRLALWTVCACAILGFAQALDKSYVTSNFAIINVANVVNQSLAIKFYERTGSALHCAMKCRQIAAKSFYFMEDLSTCTCNDKKDYGITQSDASNSMLYGYLTSENTVFTQESVNSFCQSVYNMGHRANGYYNLNQVDEHIYCNMSSLGWVVFQRRMDGSVDFYRNWIEYVEGFGNADGEFWLGLETIHQMTKAGCELHIYLEAEQNSSDIYLEAENSTVQAKGYARYSNFFVAGAETNYMLYVNGFSGNVGDSFSYHNGSQFSTLDVDNDIYRGSCAAMYKGAWWYTLCCRSNLNALYHGGSHTDSYADGIIWQATWGYYYSLLRTEMAFRC